MRQRWILLWTVVGATGSTLAWAYSSGPPDAHTGAPGEVTCHSGCHNSFALNSGSGLFTVSAPPTYSGGDTLTLSIGLQQAGQQRWGFELTVLNSSNQPVGNLIVVEPTRTQKSTFLSRQYVKHTTAGTDIGTLHAAPGWTVRWAAPAVGVGPVTFYAAGNAANGNGTNLGDYIYTRSTTVAEAALAADDDRTTPEAFDLAQNYPNPFNPFTVIHFELSERSAGPVELLVVNTVGQLVKRLVSSDFLAPGMHTAKWDGRDLSGHQVASGIYFYRLNTRDGSLARPMTLLR